MAFREMGSARRRRERWLRSWLRHERMTVRVELAARDERRFTKPEDGQLHKKYGVLRAVRRRHNRVAATLCWLGHRNGFSGTPWSSSSRLSYPCRFSMFLCRGQRTNRWTSSRSLTRCCLLLPSRLSQCPRFFSRTVSSSPASCAAARGTAGGRASDLLPRVFRREGGHGSGTILRRRRLPMVPVLWTRPREEGHHLTPSGTLWRDTPPAQGGVQILGKDDVVRFWTQSGYGRPCDHAARVPAVLRDSGVAADAVP